MASIEMVRRMAGCDPYADDPALDACAAAAVAWYAAAGVPAQTGNALYDYWVASLAAWMYDNRGDADSSARVPDYIVTSVHQLRPVPDESEATA